MGNTDPFVVENGGAIVIPRGYFPGMGNRSGNGSLHTLTFGVTHEECAQELRKIAREAGVRTRSFRQMSATEVARATGLTNAQAGRAKERETGEVFRFLGASPRKIRSFCQLACRRGFSVRRGGRFWHFSSGCDKGLACSVLTDLYQLAWRKRVHTIAVGDSPNDLLMLQLADSPILMPRPDGTFDQEITARIPEIARASNTPSQGWGLAVLRALRGVDVASRNSDDPGARRPARGQLRTANVGTPSGRRGVRLRPKSGGQKVSRRKRPKSLLRDSNAERNGA